MSTNVHVVSLHGDNTFEVLGAYATEKLAKEAMKNYAAENEFKKKIPKKDEANRLMYASATHRMYLTVQELQGGKPAHVPKAKADPNAPKKALSAYMLFAAENRATIKETNPTATFSELGKLIGEAWKALSDDAKAAYKVKEGLEKVRYQTDSAAYTATQASVA